MNRPKPPRKTAPATATLPGTRAFRVWFNSDDAESLFVILQAVDHTSALKEGVRRWMLAGNPTSHEGTLTITVNPERAAVPVAA